jgi:hypothetical protein
MNKEVASEVMARFRYIILEYSRGRNISKVCREFNIPRTIGEKDTTKKAPQACTGKSLSLIAFHARRRLK